MTDTLEFPPAGIVQREPAPSLNRTIVEEERLMQPNLPKSPRSNSKKKAALSDRKVTIARSGDDSLEVTPPIVRVKSPGDVGPRKVKWKIDADVVPAGGRLEIEFKEYNGTRGPFPSGGGNSTVRGYYKIDKKVKMTIDTSNTDLYKNPKSDGHWYYKVEVFDQNDTRIRYVDPGVAIDEDPELKPGN